MTEQKNVLIERDGRRFRWGEARYFRTWSGMKETLSVATLRLVFLPSAILFGVWAYMSGGIRREVDNRGRSFSVPTMSDVQFESGKINAPILRESDLINRIPQMRPSATGHIRVFSLRGEAVIPIATEATAVLESGATDGIVKAKLVTPMKVDGDVLLPEGTVVFGRGKSREERLAVEFRKAIFPNGETISIRAQAFDSDDKILGLKGAVVGTRTKKMGMAMAFGVLGGTMDGLQAPSTSAWGQAQQKSLRDSALGGASKAALDQSSAYLDELRKSPNIIEVKAGTEFILMIDEPNTKEEK